MELRVAFAFAVLAVSSAGCYEPDYRPLCHSADSEQLYLRDDVDLGAVETAFTEEGWTVMPPDEGIQAAMVATKEGSMLSLEATVSRQESNNTAQGHWGYVLVIVTLHESADTDQDPETKVVDAEAGLLRRLRSLGIEDRQPTPWPADYGSHWECAKV